MVNTITLTSIEDWLLITSTGRADPAPSLTLYVVSLNATIANVDKVIYA